MKDRKHIVAKIVKSFFNTRSMYSDIYGQASLFMIKTKKINHILDSLLARFEHENLDAKYVSFLQDMIKKEKESIDTLLDLMLNELEQSKKG